MKSVKTKFAPCLALFAEDYDINQELVKEMLEFMDIRVDLADDGEEALDLYKKNTYDVVFLDVQMPKIDGLQVAREIRKMDKTQPVIIAITANAMDGDREECLESGMDDYICKPVEIHQLEEVLRKYIPVAETSSTKG
jgi:two-component system, sensor histidine kinase and response regulator